MTIYQLKGYKKNSKVRSYSRRVFVDPNYASFAAGSFQIQLAMRYEVETEEITVEVIELELVESSGTKE